MFYHLDEHNPRGFEVDLCGVVVLVATLFYMYFNMLHIFTLMNMIAVTYSLMAIYYFFKAADGVIEHYDTDGEFIRQEYTEEYDFYHSAWHILIGCFVSALIYSYSNATYLTKPVRFKSLRGNVLARFVRTGTVRTPDAAHEDSSRECLAPVPISDDSQTGHSSVSDGVPSRFQWDYIDCSIHPAVVS
jgi:hypothetical protein